MKQMKTAVPFYTQLKYHLLNQLTVSTLINSEVAKVFIFEQGSFIYDTAKNIGNQF